MASKTTIAGAVGIIKATYSYAATLDDKSLANVYALMFKDIPDDIFEKGFGRAVKTCKGIPTPGDICDCIKYEAFKLCPISSMWDYLNKKLLELVDLVEQTHNTSKDEDGLTVGFKAYKKSIECYNSLPDVYKNFFGSYEGMRGHISSYLNCGNFETTKKAFDIYIKNFTDKAIPEEVFAITNAISTGQLPDKSVKQLKGGELT